MRRIDALLAEYGESHQNTTNKAIHWICVPVIVWTVLALFWSLPAPGVMAAFGVNWMVVVLILAVIYYIAMSPALAVGIAVFAALCWWLIGLAAGLPWPVWQTALVLFAIAWVGQFWGHQIEGRKPSFFKDIQFLLIGPAWLLGFLYRRFGVAY